MKARDWYILAGILLLLFGYDLNIYLSAQSIFETRCDQTIEMILWGDDCVVLYDDIAMLQIELILIGIATIICFIIGAQKNDDDSEEYQPEEETKPTNWIVNIAIGIAVVFGTFFVFYIMALN